MLFDSVNNAAKMHIHHVYFGPGNDYSLRLENHPTLNPQGIPSNSLISDSMFWEGISASNIGDSNVFSRNVIRGSSTSRHGLRLHVIDGAYGSAGMTMIDNNNIDAQGPAIEVLNGRRPQIMFNNIEQSAGGCLTCSIVDVSGSSGQVVQPLVAGNHISAFGTSISQYAIRVSNSTAATIENNDIRSDNARTAAIRIEAAASLTLLGRNVISTWFVPISNLSSSTQKLSIVPF